MATGWHRSRGTAGQGVEFVTLNGNTDKGNACVTLRDAERLHAAPYATTWRRLKKQVETHVSHLVLRVRGTRVMWAFGRERLVHDNNDAYGCETAGVTINQTKT